VRHLLDLKTWMVLIGAVLTVAGAAENRAPWDADSA